MSIDPPRLFVVHWNRPLECAATVTEFKKQCPELRTLVLDNNSKSQAIESLQTQLEPPIELVRLPENKGWGQALNIALRRWLGNETSAFCFISAHDARPAPGCIARLLAAMNADPQIGIACPEYSDGSVPRLSSWHGVAQKIAPPLAPGSVRAIDVPHGTLMLVRRDCLAQTGLFDERYFAYGDEHELGARAGRRGWKIALVGGALVANPETSTPSELRSYLFTRNSLLLVHDYFGRRAAWRRAALILLNTVRLFLRSRRGEFAFSARARWRGCRDFFLGRFGPPPAQ